MSPVKVFGVILLGQVKRHQDSKSRPLTRQLGEV